MAEPIQDLIARHLDGRISAADRAHLSSLVASDPQVARILAHSVRIDMELHDLHRVGASDAAHSISARIERANRAIDETDRRPAGRAGRAGRADQTAGSRGTRRRTGRRGPRRTAPRRRPLMAAVTIVGVAAVVGMLLVLGQPLDPSPRTPGAVIATIDDATGRVLIRGDASERAAELGTDLRDGDAITTGPDAGIRFRYHDGTRIDLRSDSVLRIRASASTHTLVLERGGLDAAVVPRTAEHRLRIRSPHALAEILGTQLSLSAGERSTRLAVEEGRVRFQRASDGRAIVVEAGRYAVAGSGLELVAHPLTTVPPAIASYRFDAGSGSVVEDRSPVGEPLDLMLHGRASWIADPPGLRFRSTADEQGAAASDRPAGKLYDAITTSGELSIATWIRPTVRQQSGPARIVVYGVDDRSTNFALAHGGWITEDAFSDNMIFRLRTEADPLGLLGLPAVEARDAFQTRLGHYAVTYDGSEVGMYRNGELIQASARAQESFEHWVPSAILALGNEADTLERPWHGDIHQLAIYDRALDPAQIRQLFLGSGRLLDAYQEAQAQGP